MLENLKNRRSIRKYKPEQIEADKLDAILEAGLYATFILTAAPSPSLHAIGDAPMVSPVAVTSKHKATSGETENAAVCEPRQPTSS